MVPQHRYYHGHSIIMIQQIVKPALSIFVTKVHVLTSPTVVTYRQHSKRWHEVVLIQPRKYHSVFLTLSAGMSKINYKRPRDLQQAKILLIPVTTWNTSDHIQTLIAAVAGMYFCLSEKGSWTILYDMLCGNSLKGVYHEIFWVLFLACMDGSRSV